jgi:mono/diheme cytochrome c family protein
MRLWMSTVALLALAACGDNGGDSAGADLVGDPAAGKTIFSQTCAQSNCHGPDGTGSDPSSSADDLNQVVPGLSDAEIEVRIKEGFGLMAPVGGLSNQDVADVIAYVRQTFGG